MAPPRRSAAKRLSPEGTDNDPSTSPSPTKIAPGMRRSPRIAQYQSSKVNQPYRSPFSRQESTSSISSGIAQLGLRGKRPSSQAITPLRELPSGRVRINDNAPSHGQNASTPPARRSIISTATSQTTSLDSEVPSATSSSQGSDTLELCGLPSSIQQLYQEKRNITSLYDWQKECLADSRLCGGDNAIICLPTGAGKTLVAEVLMLREALVNKRNSLLILPYVAIVQEKITSLAIFEDDFGVHVEEYAATKGRLPPIKRRRGTNSIYVATIEKAKMLVNSLIENGRLDDLGLIVVDELHMIGEGSRGACIESTLTKYREKGVGQIVGISATLTNMDELARFMGAFVYTTNFRPVELTEMVRIGQRMLRVTPHGTLIHHADLPPNKLASRDPDGLCQLLQKTIPNHSCIIFCPTKRNCENVAVMIAHAIPKQLREVKKAERTALIDAIKEEADGNLDGNLERCLEAGIAWHHSGLTHDERKVIEAAYVAGTLCVLCATSTLAAGVNLPARRVIIKAPTVGRDRLRKAQYLQMIGRAGRAGFNEKGEAITIVRAGPEEAAFRAMLEHEEMRCASALGNPEEMAGFVLDTVSLKIVEKVADLEDMVLKRTFLAVQKGEEEVRALLRATIDRLKAEELIEESPDSGLSVTEVGTAAFGASVAPSESTVLRKDLITTLTSGVNFSSHLHLLYIIAPYDLWCAVDWDVFYDEFVALPESEKQLLERSGVSMQKILMQITRKTPLKAGDAAMRLYVALMMQHVWKQVPHSTVSSRFAVDRGWLQAALQSIVSHAAAISRFSERLPSLWPLRLLLPELVSRLSECTRPELLPLLQLDFVKRKRAAMLYAAGLRTVADVSIANVDVMVRRVENLSRHQALKIVQSAKALIRDQVDEKLEEFEALGMRPEFVDGLRLSMQQQPNKQPKERVEEDPMH